MSQATGSPCAGPWLDRPCAALAGPYRELLMRLGLGGTALALGPQWLMGCGEHGPGGSGAEGSHLPYSMWRELQRAVRLSPDHLPGRAEKLVAAGDLEGLVGLVADDMRTLRATMSPSRISRSTVMIRSPRVNRWTLGYWASFGAIQRMKS